MEVLQRRELNWRVNCSKGCNSQLEVVEADLHVFVDWEGDASFYVICPVCGIRVYGFRDIPNEIRQRVIEKCKGAS